MMRLPSTAELLQIWEAGHNQPPVQRILWLLAAAYPQTSLDTLAQLSLGQRDACLLSLRERLFGSQLSSLAVCPHCGDRLELTLNVADIRGNSGEIAPPASITITVNHHEVQFRLPNSLDMLAIAHSPGTDPRSLLLQRCLIRIHPELTTDSPQVIPDSIQEAIEQHMAAADPQANIQLALQCPVCTHQWQVVLDVVSFFWSEIQAWGYRTLRDVHTLAMAYGWREADILSLTPQRRQLYLDMVSGRVH